MRGFGPTTYGEAFADVYDEWYERISDVEATVDRVAELAEAAGGASGATRSVPVLELGVGTGRLALPMAARGLDVWGVDASAAMLARLRAKPGGGDLRVVRADMAAPALRPGPRFAVVFCAYNTFFNLSTEAAQSACLAWCASLLVPGGRLAIEAFVPSEAGRSDPVTVRSIEIDRVVLSVVQRDAADQTAVGHYVELSEEGGVRLRPWLIRYLQPAQLDGLAEAAGLVLDERWADWTGAPFDDDSVSHVSVYRPA